MMNVYKIYDDTWSTISGPEQLRGFTIDQMKDMLCVNSDEEVVENIHEFMSKKNRDFACKVLGDLREDDTALDNASEEFLIDLLKIMGFKVEKLNVH